MITYTYDSLYQLTSADYVNPDTGENGHSFAYTYDSIGNRLTKEECLEGFDCLTTSYTYDIANRLATVDAGTGLVTYAWDDNGNLLDDGENTYTYNHANRLVSVSSPPSSVSFTYNGFGDRMQQTVDGDTTTYTLDLAVGLTQVLADGVPQGDDNRTYLYGVGRIGEVASANWAYHQHDALGSVRQLTDADGTVTLTKSYMPYGEELSSSGMGASNYGFTGEMADIATGLIYLRARYYSPWDGRFIRRDTFFGDRNLPQSLHLYNYGSNNPIRFTDPTGHSYLFHWRNPASVTVGEAVDYFSWIFSKKGLYDCDAVPDDGYQLPFDKTSDLWFDYLCERGPDHRKFSELDYLTKELARSHSLKVIREEFYILNPMGEAIIDKEMRFNQIEFSIAWFDWLIVNASQTSSFPSPNVTHFLGSFTYSVERKGNHVEFTIENQTDRSSGTHFPLRFPEKYDEYLEDLADKDETLLSAWWSRPVISVLAPKTRDQTSDYVNPPEGGGVMLQTFKWKEPDLACEMKLIPWPLYLTFIDFLE